MEAGRERIGDVYQDEIRSLARDLGNGLHLPGDDSELLIRKIIETDLNRLAGLDLA